MKTELQKMMRCFLIKNDLEIALDKIESRIHEYRLTYIPSDNYTESEKRLICYLPFHQDDYLELFDYIRTRRRWDGEQYVYEEKHEEDHIYINLKDPIQGYRFDIMSNFIEVDEGCNYLAENHFNGIVDRFRPM